MDFHVKTSTRTLFREAVAYEILVFLQTLPRNNKERGGKGGIAMFIYTIASYHVH
jgi:hypothetical protein